MRHSNWTRTVERYLAEGRSVSGGKGDETVKSSEKASLNFQNRLQSAFKQQFGQQSAILSYLQGKMQGQIDNPQGYTPEALAAMKTQATEGTAKAFAQAQQANHAIEAGRGQSGLPSGVSAQLDAQNAVSGAQMQSAGLNNIELADSNLKNQNYWNAVQGLSGVAAGLNPTSFAGAGSGAAGNVANSSQAYSASQSAGFFNTLANSFAGSLGSGLGGAASGGIPGMKALG